MAEDTQTSASDDLSEIESYDMADFKSPEARVEPYRRRKKWVWRCGEFQPRYCHVVFRFRLRRRKNRYEPPLVVPTQEQELSPDVLYERDSSYNAPSSSYEAPGYSNSYKEYKMIFTPSLGPEAPYLGVLIFLINEENHSISLLSLRHTRHPATAQATKPTEGETSYILSHLSSLLSLLLKW